VKGKLIESIFMDLFRIYFKLALPTYLTKMSSED
jgi:hypothetical protein